MQTHYKSRYSPFFLVYMIWLLWKSDRRNYGSFPNNSFEWQKRNISMNHGRIPQLNCQSMHNLSDSKWDFNANRFQFAYYYCVWCRTFRSVCQTKAQCFLRNSVYLWWSKKSWTCIGRLPENCLSIITIGNIRFHLLTGYSFLTGCFSNQNLHIRTSVISFHSELGT